MQCAELAILHRTNDLFYTLISVLEVFIQGTKERRVVKKYGKSRDKVNNIWASDVQDFGLLDNLKTHS